MQNDLFKRSTSTSSRRTIFSEGPIRVVQNEAEQSQRLGSDFPFKIYVGEQEIDATRNKTKALAKGKRYARKLPKVGDWYKTPTTQYGKAAQKVIAQISGLENSHVVIETHAPGRTDHRSKYTIPLALLLIEGSKMRNPPRKRAINDASLPLSNPPAPKPTPKPGRIGGLFDDVFNQPGDIAGDVGWPVEELLGEPAGMHSDLLKPTDGLEPQAAFTFRFARAWMVKTDASGPEEAAKIGRRARRNLIGKRSLTAAQPYLHDRDLYVAYPGGYVHLPASPRINRRTHG